MAVYQSLSLTQVSQDRQENTSRVRVLWESTQTGGSFNDTRRTATYTVCCNGQPAEEFTVSYTLPRQSTVTVLDTVLTVPHDQKGDASLTVTTRMNTNISAGVVTLSKTLVPEPIPQAATLLAADGVIGATAAIAITKKSSSHTHSLAYRFGSLTGFLDGNGQVQPEEVRFSGESLNFPIPMDFYGQIPDARQGICQLTLSTYLGDTLVGQPQSTAFTVSVNGQDCAPVVTGYLADQNESTKALTGDETLLIPYGSSALCSITAQPRLGASIVRLCIDGEEAPQGTRLLPALQGDTVALSAEDSRGFLTAVTIPVNKIPYEKPAFEVQAVRTDPVSGNALLQITGSWYGGSFGACDNALQVAYSIAGGEFIPVQPVEEGNRFSLSVPLEAMAYDRVYPITVQVRDSLVTLQKQAVLKKTLPVFDWGEGDFVFHVPVSMDSPLGLAQGGTGVGAWDSGLVIKKPEDTCLSVLQPEPGALFARENRVQSGILPVTLGGTGGDTVLQAQENIGLCLPMELGCEYATNFRHLGQVVYTKLVDYGALPNTGAKAVPHGAAARSVLACRGTTSSGRTLPWGGIHAYRADLFCDCESIYIDTEKDESHQTATVQLYYIK